ncbi:leucine rich repeat domain protein [Onchocerca flexuosa]|uniref:Leucine rich repeat domain protein n=1 Tax=Onchocerca flexuosa TaxID=387005 RepID=A0A238BY36_9BILA|nr:leucine rich repeat domain protein [Onchocerca flexuosa]
MWEGRGAHCRNWEDNGLRRLSYPNMLLLIRGVAILHLTLAIKTASNSCPHPCSCSHDTVICTGQGLLRIPSRIPPDTVRLQLMDNQIHMIESEAFDNLVALERLRLNEIVCVCGHYQTKSSSIMSIYIVC